MTHLTVDEQIAALRRAKGLAAGFHHWLLALAALAAVAAVVFWYPVPLMFAAFLGVVGLSERAAGPNIVAAVDAYDTGASTVGSVTVSLHCWDTDTHYHAVVRETGQPDWRYTFVPQGWEPVAQTCAARIWRRSDGGPPVLAAVEQGVLVPRDRPTLVDGNGQSHRPERRQRAGATTRR